MPLITAWSTPRVELPTALERRWQALRILEGRGQAAGEKALQAEHGVSASEYAALAALAYSNDGGHLRQQTLADAIPLNQSSVSRLVGRLEKLGLTERYLCATDRRGVYTQITEQGRALVAAAHDTYLRALDAALDQAVAEDDLGPVVAFIRSDGAPSAG
ncbi:MAG: MarR family winged helix-turn-helix transcriptional regulator [Mycobacteriales bacterium]